MHRAVLWNAWLRTTKPIHQSQILPLLQLQIRTDMQFLMTSSPDVHFTYSNQSWGFWRCPDHWVPNAGVCHMCQEMRWGERFLNPHYQDPSFYPSSFCHSESLAVFCTPCPTTAPHIISATRGGMQRSECQIFNVKHLILPSSSNPALKNLNLT